MADLINTISDAMTNNTIGNAINPTINSNTSTQTPFYPTLTGQPISSAITPVDVSGKVNASNLNSDTKLTTGATVDTSGTNGFVNGLNNGNQQQTINTQNAQNQNQQNIENQQNNPVNNAVPNNPQATADEQQIQSLMTQLGYKATDTANLQNQADITGKNNQLSDLNVQYAQAKAKYDNLYNQIGSQNIPSLFVSGQEALNRAAAATELGGIEAQRQAVQGNINSANKIIEDTITQKYAPIQANLDNMQKYYDSVDKPKLAAQIEAQKTQVSNEQALTAQAQKDLQTQITSGQIDQSAGFKAMSDLLSKKISIGEFYNQINVASPVGSSSTGNNNGNAIVQQTMQMIGATQDMPVSQAITQIGMQNIVNGIIGQEGSSPKGVLNNPGNIKYVGQSGATDSGVKATDGGTFASFKTPQAGQDAVASLVQKAANAGKNLSDFIASYKGVSNSLNTPTYQQYGLLANVPDFNVNSQKDKDAQLYLNEYIKNATLPSYYTLWGRTPGHNLSGTVSRAQDLFFKATGQALPDFGILKGNKTLVNTNNKLENNLNIQEGTVGKNFALAIQNIDKNGINQSAQPINAFLNTIKDAMGDPAVAQYITQNGTLQNEVGSLIAIKNASGTTVADKLASAGLVPQNATEDQQKAILKILLQEAQNGFDTIKSTSGELYKQIDPLETDINNPNRIATTQKPFTDNLQKLGMTDAGNNTLNIPRANWDTLRNTHDDASGLSQADALQQALKAKGYNIVVQ